jgi:hypothetical protein
VCPGQDERNLVCEAMIDSPKGVVWYQVSIVTVGFRGKSCFDMGLQGISPGRVAATAGVGFSHVLPWCGRKPLSVKVIIHTESIRTDRQRSHCSWWNSKGGWPCSICALLTGAEPRQAGMLSPREMQMPDGDYNKKARKSEFKHMRSIIQ